MTKYFYSHIIETTSLTLAVGDLPVNQKERLHLLSLIESNINHEILDLVLSQLDDEDKKEFLKHLKTSDHKSAWKILVDKIENVEEQIYQAGEKIKKTFHNDIENVKKKK